MLEIVQPVYKKCSISLHPGRQMMAPGILLDCSNRHLVPNVMRHPFRVYILKVCSIKKLKFGITTQGESTQGQSPLSKEETFKRPVQRFLIFFYDSV